MIAHGTWGAFVAEREELKSAGVSGWNATKGLLDKYMPKPGQEPLPGAGKRPVYAHRAKNKAEYEKVMKGKVRSEVGADMHAPGEIRGDGEGARVEAMDVEAGIAPGDFGGGEGDVGVGEAVVDEAEDRDVLLGVGAGGAAGVGDGLDEFVGQQGGMRFEAQLRWVIAHIDDDEVKVKSHAPHPMAWTYLSTCRKSMAFKEKFLLTFGPKLLPKNVGEEKGVEGDEFDGDEIVDALDLVRASADKAKGRVGSI
jgi:hypothetical protein